MLSFLILAMFSSPIQFWEQNEEPELIYVGDPMCSWCYGFTGQWNELLLLQPSLKVKYIMGGLRPDGNEAMKDLKDFLKEHWLEIHHRTGMPFKYEILDKDMVYNTEPACRAVVTVRHLFPQNTKDFFQKTQMAFYFENHNPYATASYKKIVDGMGLDGEAFEKFYTSEPARKMVVNDFATAAQLGANGFPTVLLKFNNQYHIISRGYTETTLMNARIRKILGV